MEQPFNSRIWGALLVGHQFKPSLSTTPEGFCSLLAFVQATK